MHVKEEYLQGDCCLKIFASNFPKVLLLVSHTDCDNYGVCRGAGLTFTDLQSCMLLHISLFKACIAVVGGGYHCKSPAN